MQENNAPDNKKDTAPPLINSSRRRFTTAGVAATGMLATLASRPVLGADCTAGVSPSAWCSGNKSAGHLPTGQFGHLPQYYVDHPTAYPTSVTPATPYKDIFSSYGNSGLKFSDALASGTDLQKATAAAYLNAVKGLTPYLTAMQVVPMATGNYSPFAGTTWNSATIVLYLNGTFAA